MSSRTPPASQSLASLVTPAYLLRALSSPCPPAVLDVRGAVRKLGPPDPSGRQLVEYTACSAAYAASHIPSASFLDWRDVRTHPVATFVRAMEARGVSRTKPVVIYDDGRMLFATRVWFTLLAAG